MINPGTPSVNKRRIRQLNGKKVNRGPVIYWMSRDQRVNDNWALLYSIELARELETSVVVAFALTDSFPGANLRHYSFMLKGLKEVEKALIKKNIPFRLLTGNPPSTISALVKETRAGAIVTDFDPLRIKNDWKKELVKIIDIPLYDVDTHNIVPCRVASGKQEYGAYTIRPKIKKLLSEFLDEFPKVSSFGNSSAKSDKTTGWEHENYAGTENAGRDRLKLTNWEAVKKKLPGVVRSDATEVEWLIPGENAAASMLNNFLSNKLSRYSEKRNDPNANVISHMSPYLHFGQISAQRIALEILKNFPKDPNTDAYLEELIVRRELSDNFCHFNPHYDSFEGFPQWAKETLNEHRKDEREYLYNKELFEAAETHDILWNAAQREMVKRGKMHGYMRMYWAKKILEWSASPEDALNIALYLNDKYELDGRDPNGYAGCAWSIGGVHDRAWAGRPVFGKIRYMNANGCKRKFNTGLYINNYSNFNKKPPVLPI